MVPCGLRAVRWVLFVFGATDPRGARASFTRSVDDTTTRHSRWDSSGRVINPSQRLLPDNTQHSQQTCMPPVGFEPTISAGERPHTYALDRAATVTGIVRWGSDVDSAMVTEGTFFNTRRKLPVSSVGESVELRAWGCDVTSLVHLHMPFFGYWSPCKSIGLGRRIVIF
jgi:hypothetical protein